LAARARQYVEEPDLERYRGARTLLDVDALALLILHDLARALLVAETLGLRLSVWSGA
jgi:hypothetical protein